MKRIQKVVLLILVCILFFGCSRSTRSKICLDESTILGNWESIKEYDNYPGEYMYQVLNFPGHDNLVRLFYYDSLNGRVHYSEGKYEIHDDQVELVFDTGRTVNYSAEEEGRVFLYYIPDSGRYKGVEEIFYKDELLKEYPKDYEGNYQPLGIYQSEQFFDVSGFARVKRINSDYFYNYNGKYTSDKYAIVMGRFVIEVETHRDYSTKKESTTMTVMRRVVDDGD